MKIRTILAATAAAAAIAVPGSIAGDHASAATVNPGGPVIGLQHRHKCHHHKRHCHTHKGVTWCPFIPAR